MVRVSRPRTIVYVEVPPSPYSTGISKITSTLAATLPSSYPNGTKRKSLGSATGRQSKRSRVEVVITKAAPGAHQGKRSDAVICHLCHKEITSPESVRCTLTKLNPRDDRPKQCCDQSFCFSCLRTRDGKPAGESRMKPAKGAKDTRPESHSFKCPVCHNLCQCSGCESRHCGILPSAASQSNSKSNVVQPRKVAPVLRWSNLSGSLSRHTVEDRIHIREFVVRFRILMSKGLSNSQVREFEKIADYSTNHADDDIPRWVSEGCVKSLVVCLLDLISTDDVHCSCGKMIESTLEEVQIPSTSMTTMWLALTELQRNLIEFDGVCHSILCSLPDPLPPPAAMLNLTRQTRRTQRASLNSVLILHPGQMIPVILALMDRALQTSRLRQELEEGIHRGKESSRLVRELGKEEVTRWNLERQAMGEKHSELKSRRLSHKMCLKDLDAVTKINSLGVSSRCGPLGADEDGHVFWALSPPACERTDADNFVVQFKPSASKNNATQTGPSDIPKWTTFVLVWGKPFGTDSMGPESDTAEAWWVFEDPTEIRRVAEWYTVEYGTRSNCPVDSSPELPAERALPSNIKRLTSGLQDFATLLEWRLAGSFRRGSSTVVDLRDGLLGRVCTARVGCKTGWKEPKDNLP
ncbi:hypothetical protein BDN72DRAFT_878887 [Pluteus cervinus]|uniref:Uncharacterized protein n=1 Tax=Pluteus cervinus TaxID=181527 RepID=A0ACD3ARY7_9AGAR|nr:hypothetical protein BDN72DRAFT_878887 [Pluteus cervinus]